MSLNSLFLFDKLERLVDIVSSEELSEWIHILECNQYEQAAFELPATFQLKNVHYFGFFYKKDEFKIFKVADKKIADTLYVEGIDKAEGDLRTVSIIKDRRPQNVTADQALAVALEGSGYNVGNVSGLPEVRSLSFFYISPAEALAKIIETFNCEFRIRYTFVENRIVGRYIDLAKRFGSASGKQFIYGDNALSIVHEESTDEVITALIGRGKGEPTDNDGFGRRLEFTDVVWRRSDGKPIDKPAGQNFVVSDSSRQLYGISQNGQLKHRFGVYVNEDIEDPELLLQKTFEELQRLSVPVSTFRANILSMNGEAEYGDSVAVIHDDVGIAFQARLFKIVIDKLNHDRSIVDLGDYETLQDRTSKLKSDRIRSEIDSGMSHYSKELEEFYRRVEEEKARRDAEIDEKFRVAEQEFENFIRLADQNAQSYADNIKQTILGQMAESDRQYQLAQQAQDQQIAESLRVAGASTNLANTAKSLAEQAKAELTLAKQSLGGQITQLTGQAGQLERSLGLIRTDVTSQAQSILAQAQRQTELTSRVVTVENIANGTKSTVTELSKTLTKATGDIASVSSRTKTVEDTLTQTRTQYEALTQTVNEHTGQIDSVSRRTGTIEAGLTGLQERFENIRVGATNYIRDFGFANGHSFNNNQSVWRYERIEDGTARSGYHIKATCTQAGWGGFHKALYDLRGARYQGRVMTYSVDIKTSKSVRMRLGAEAFSRSLQIFDATTEWQRFISTDTVGYKNFYSFPFYTDGVQWQVGDVIYIRDPQLEDGNIATTPHAAEEDLRSDLATYKRTAEESSVDLSRQIQLADGKAVEAKTFAQQAATQLSTRLTSLETYKDGEATRASQYFAASRDETARQVTALRTAVTDGYVAKAKYEEDARGVTQRFESLRISGENLIKNGGFPTNTSYWSGSMIVSQHSYYYNGQKKLFLLQTSGQAEITASTNRFEVKRNTDYTLSFYAFASSNVRNADVFFLGRKSSESSNFASANLIINSRRFSPAKAEFVTATFNSGDNDSGYIRFDNNGSTDGNNAVLFFGEVMLVEGRQAGIFSQNTEDVSDTKIAEYRTTVDGRFATMQSETIPQAILASKQIKDTRNDNQTPQWYWSNYPKQTVEEFKIASVIGLANESRFAVLTTNVQWDNDTGGKVKQTAKTDRATYERYGTGSTWDPWVKVANMSDLANYTTRVDFQRVQETSQLYERIIGSSDAGIASNVARMAMTSSLFQSEVTKYSNATTNLVVDSNYYRRARYHSSGISSNDVSLSAGNVANAGTLTIKVRNQSVDKYAGILVPMYLTKILQGDKFTVRCEVRVLNDAAYPLNRDAYLEIKRHTGNLVAAAVKLADATTPKGSWVTVEQTVTARTTIDLQSSNYDGVYVWLRQNGAIEVRNIMVVAGEKIGPFNANPGDSGEISLDAVTNRVSQLAGSWAVQNLTSAGTILNQFNLLANGTNRIDGRLTHITGQTLIDNGVIKSAMIGSLDAGKITSGYLSAARIASEAITADKIKVDQALFTKLMADEALFKQLFAKNAFITQVQAVTLSASKISGGVLSSKNGETIFNLDEGVLDLHKNGTIRFHTGSNAIYRQDGIGVHTAFLNFDTVDGHLYAGFGVTSSSEGLNSRSTGRFTGIRCFRTSKNPNIYEKHDNGVIYRGSHETSKDEIDVVGDYVRLIDDFHKNRGVLARPVFLPEGRWIDLIKLAESVEHLWNCWGHAKNGGMNPPQAIMDERNRYQQYFYTDKNGN